MLDAEHFDVLLIRLLAVVVGVGAVVVVVALSLSTSERLLNIGNTLPSLLLRFFRRVVSNVIAEREQNEPKSSTTLRQASDRLEPPIVVVVVDFDRRVKLATIIQFEI